VYKTILSKNKPLINSQDKLGRLSILISSLIVISLYWRWMFPGAITWGDWWFYGDGSLSDMAGSMWGSGLGGYQIIGASLQPLISLTGFLYRAFHWSYPVIERVVCFLPLILFFIFSPWYLAATLGCNRFAIAAAILVFNLNTIMVLNTAVTTLSLAAAFGPFVLAVFIKLLDKPEIKNAFLFGLLASLQMIYDIRIAYIYFLFCGLYLAYLILLEPAKYILRLPKVLLILLLSVFIIALLHSFWIIPLFFAKFEAGGASLLPQGYDSSGWVKTLSYWSLLHVFGIQSPWWGRAGIINPVNPQFLFMPIMVFSVFLLPIGKKIRGLLFFGFSALIFIFLAKGSKPPFGEIYILLFKYFPGFSMFREPGKWWSPAVLCYSIIIAYGVDHLTSKGYLLDKLTWLKNRTQLIRISGRIILSVVLISLFFLVFPVNPVSILKYSAMFTPYKVPDDSKQIEDFLHNQKGSFRTLWLPLPYRFGYSSFYHPAVGSIDLGSGILSGFRSGDSRFPMYNLSYLNNQNIAEVLSLFSIKYIIVPFVDQDSPAEIYYWYELPRDYYEKLAEGLPYASEIKINNKYSIFELKDPLPTFYASRQCQLFLGNNLNFLPVVAESNFFDNNYPIVAFDQKMPSADIFKSAKRIILQDYVLEDISIELSAQMKVILTRENLSKGLEIDILKPAIFELWTDYDFQEVKDKELNLIFDKNTYLPVNCVFNNRKYHKLGEVSLSSGKHSISLENLPGKGEDNNPGSICIMVADKVIKNNVYQSIISEVKRTNPEIIRYFKKSGRITLD